jgi:hypothetical protein
MSAAAHETSEGGGYLVVVLAGEEAMDPMVISDLPSLALGKLFKGSGYLLKNEILFLRLFLPPSRRSFCFFGGGRWRRSIGGATINYFVFFRRLYTAPCSGVGPRRTVGA